MDKDHRINQIEEPDMNGVFTDNTPGAITSYGNLSFFKDEEAKAWERGLFAPCLVSSDFFGPAPDITLSDRKVQKEARELLWKQNLSLPTVIPAAPLSKNEFAQAGGGEEAAEGTNPVQSTEDLKSFANGKGYAAGRRSAVKPDYANGRRNPAKPGYAAGRRNPAEPGYAAGRRNPESQALTGGQRYASRQNRAGGQAPRYTRNVSSRASARSSIHDSAWEILTGNEPAQNSRRSMRTNPQKISKISIRGLAFIVLLTFLLSILIIISTFFFINHISSNADSRGTIESDIFIGDVCKPTPDVDFIQADPASRPQRSISQFCVNRPQRSISQRSISQFCVNRPQRSISTRHDI